MWRRQWPLLVVGEVHLMPRRHEKDLWTKRQKRPVLLGLLFALSAMFGFRPGKSCHKH
jgi:hypothetical protein